MRQQVIRLGLTLLVVGLIAAIGLGLTYTITQKKIAEEDKLSEAKAAVDALPGTKSASELKLDDALLKKAKKAVPDVQKVYTSDVGTIFLIQMKGYGGPLVLAVGIGKDGKVVGIAPVSNKETIGLGSRALEKGFLKQYNGKTSSDPVQVGKDIQAITGATITSKAVTGEVRAALEAFMKSQ
jgi:electron transport complex protein RnfG